MNSEFVYTGLPVRVVFGPGSARSLDRELERLDVQRAMVICTPGKQGQGEGLRAQIGARCAGVHAHAVMHTPVETARAGVEEARRLDADCLLAIGGGSAIGLAKAIALSSALPILAVPTTYSGSEMTPVQGITEGGIKRSHRDLRMLPKTVVYDPVLTVSLPAPLSVTSALNGIAHACEALYARDANPLTTLIAEEGIRSFRRGLPAVARDPADLAARGDCLVAAWYCGTALASVGMALHHKLCHTLGGSFGLPHSQTHAIILPHALAFNQAAAPQAMRRIAAALDASDAPEGVYDFAAGLGAPLALKDIGMREADLERAAELAMDAPYWNPRAADRAAVRRLLDDAYHGRRPRGERDPQRAPGMPFAWR
jgi:alcohol dehydrogenase class IV